MHLLEKVIQLCVVVMLEGEGCRVLDSQGSSGSKGDTTTYGQQDKSDLHDDNVDNKVVDNKYNNNYNNYNNSNKRKIVETLGETLVIISWVRPIPFSKSDTGMSRNETERESDVVPFTYLFTGNRGREREKDKTIDTFSTQTTNQRRRLIRLHGNSLHRRSGSCSRIVSLCVIISCQVPLVYCLQVSRLHTRSLVYVTHQRNNG